MLGKRRMLNWSRVTMRSKHRCQLGEKAYYELEILDDDGYPQYGFASAAFKRVLGSSCDGVGDDDVSWGVDGVRKRRWHKKQAKLLTLQTASEIFTEKKEKEDHTYDYEWKKGDSDVIGVACDLQATPPCIMVSVNGQFAERAVFNLPISAVKNGLFAAFTGYAGEVRYNFGDNFGNFGEKPFKHDPPSSDYKTFLY